MRAHGYGAAITRTPGSPGPPLARTTSSRPPPRFGAQELALLERGLRRRLCEALLTESGAHVVGVQTSPMHDELVLLATVLWTRRTVRVRIAAAPVDQLALDRLEARVREAGDAQGVMIAAHGLAGPCHPDHVVQLVEPDTLIARLQRSALIAWPGRKPELAFERLPGSRRLTQATATLDALGIRWLPTLAQDRLPPEIADVGEAPQHVLERVAFRLLTSVFRFGGTRTEAALRGPVQPDAVLHWPAGNPVRDAALLVSVAAKPGFTMDADDEGQLETCVEAARRDEVAGGRELAFLIVLASGFPGPRGRRHPHQLRAQALAQRAGVMLVYLRAVDLVRLAVAVEGRELSPAAREALPWSEVLAAGNLRFEDLERLLVG